MCQNATYLFGRPLVFNYHLPDTPDKNIVELPVGRGAFAPLNSLGVSLIPQIMTFERAIAPELAAKR